MARIKIIMAAYKKIMSNIKDRRGVEGDMLCAIAVTSTPTIWQHVSWEESGASLVQYLALFCGSPASFFIFLF